MDPDQERDAPLAPRRSLSWVAMLLLVLLAIVIASGLAYLLVDPFFHRRAW